MSTTSNFNLFVNCKGGELVFKHIINAWETVSSHLKSITEMNTIPGTVVGKCTQKEAVLTVIRIITRDKFHRPVALFSSFSFCPFCLVLESFLVGFLHHQSLAS